jgi:hypothetical protein
LEAVMARKLEIAFWNYDRTRLLAEGVVKIEWGESLVIMRLDMEIGYAEVSI